MSGSTTVVNSGTPSRPNTARPGTGKSAIATAGLGGGTGRFEVKIERVTTAELMKDDDDEEAADEIASSGGSGSTRYRKWKEAGFDEEIEMGHLGVR